MFGRLQDGSQGEKAQRKGIGRQFSTPLLSPCGLGRELRRGKGDVMLSAGPAVACRGTGNATRRPRWAVLGRRPGPPLSQTSPHLGRNASVAFLLHCAQRKPSNSLRHPRREHRRHPGWPGSLSWDSGSLALSAIVELGRSPASRSSQR